MVNDNISTNGLNDSAGMNGAHDMNDNNNNALNENSDSRPPSLPAFASPDILRLPTAAFNVRIQPANATSNNDGLLQEAARPQRPLNFNTSSTSPIFQYNLLNETFTGTLQSTDLNGSIFARLEIRSPPATNFFQHQHNMRVLLDLMNANTSSYTRLRNIVENDRHGMFYMPAAPRPRLDNSIRRATASERRITSQNFYTTLSGTITSLNQQSADLSRLNSAYRDRYRMERDAIQQSLQMILNFVQIRIFTENILDCFDANSLGHARVLCELFYQFWMALVNMTNSNRGFPQTQHEQ